MNRKRTLFFLPMVLITILVMFTMFGHVQAAATLIVPDNYSTIQAAVDAALAGDTIVVRPGTYLESVTLNKSITLTAESFDPDDPTHNTVMIDSGATNLVNTISVPSHISPMPTVRGFVIRNGSDGISTYSDMVIEYNYFLGAVDQVDYSQGGGGINRSNIYYSSGDDAIDIDNAYRPLLIENNKMLYSGDDGIEIRLQDTSAPPQMIEITLQNNQFIGADEDGIQLIDYGQAVDTNRRFIIHHNIVANSRFAGIGLMPGENTTEDYSGADVIEAVRVYNNTFYGNNYGISGGDNLVAFNNIVVNSITKGVWRVEGPAGANSVVARTLFYNNGVDAEQSLLAEGNLFGQNPAFAYPPNAGLDGLWGTIDDDFSGLWPVGGSPAIDSGTTQYLAVTGEAVPPSPISGFGGNAPDLGWKEYDPFAPPTSTPTSTFTPTSTPSGFAVVTSQVIASFDDAEQAISGGSTSLSSSDLELGADGTTLQWSGMRFNNITIPRGAFILNAYVEFEVDEIGSDPTSVTFQGQAIDNAPPFSGSSYNISNRARTTAQVAWNNIPVWSIVHAKWQTPDLSPIVQEIVDRPGWSAGNSLVIVAQGTGRRTAEAHDGEPAAAAKIVIQYMIGVPSTATLVPTSTLTPTPTSTSIPTLTPTSSGSGVNDEIHWTITGPNSVSIDWRGPSNTIDYGITTAYGQSLTGAAPSPLPFSSAGPFWEAKLTNLQPDTTYHYSIGGGPDHTFKTAPAKGSSGFTVEVIGDVGETIAYPNVGPIQALIAADQPSMVLLVGDISYADPHGQYAVDQHFNDLEVWSGGSTAYMPAWGNHEWQTETIDDLRNYKGRFDFPNPQTSPGSPAISCCGEDWYYFDYGNTRFIAYPEPWSGAWSAWNTQVTALMDQAQADPSITFIVTYGHRPVYSSGYNPGVPALRTYLDNLGATHSKYVLNLNGHSHNYERTFPQNNVVYITAGTGGGSLEQTGTCLWLMCTQPSWSAKRYMREGVVRLTFNADSIQGAFLCGPAGGGTNDIICNLGDVIDTFTIEGANPTATPTGTPTDTGTPTQTPTPTNSPTLVSTFTPTDTATSTQTLTATFTQTFTPSPTDTSTATATFTATNTEVPTQTWTATPTPTFLPTATNTATATDTMTPTNTVAPTPTYTVTSTSTFTPTSTQTSTSTATHTPTASATPSDVIFADGFESGNLAKWSSSVTDAGDLSVSTGAALVGNYGLRAVIDDNNPIYVSDASPNAETRYRARFYFDPNSIAMSSNDSHYIFYGYSGASTVVLRLELRFSKGSYQIRVALRNDSSSWTSSSWFTISDTAHVLEIDWRASTASGANNGGLTLWIDTTQRANLSGVDNDTRRIDIIQLGAISGIDSGTRGTDYFDAFESHRQNYIGP